MVSRGDTIHSPSSKDELLYLKRNTRSNTIRIPSDKTEALYSRPLNNNRSFKNTPYYNRQQFSDSNEE